MPAKVCSKCGTPFTLDSVIEPPRRRWREILENITPETRRRIQWCYFLFSVALLGWLLAYCEQNQEKHWVGHALLSVIFLAASGLLSVLLTPRQVIQNFSRHCPRLTKLAFVANYLAALLLLQIMIGKWWERALILAGLLAVTCLGAWLLCRVLWPMTQQVRGLYDDSGQPFDPSAPQGRRGRFD